MLVLVEDSDHKRAAQEAMEKTVKAAIKNQGKSNIGFPSGNVDEVIYSNGHNQLWCAFKSFTNVKIPRRWNAFGVFDEKRKSQIITVEINIPTIINSARVAGFFARDNGNGQTFLMHDGSIGGGRLGIGRNAFLDWSKTMTVEVAMRGRSARRGIVIGNVSKKDLPSRIMRFVRLVRDFKEAVSRGEIDVHGMSRPGQPDRKGGGAPPTKDPYVRYMETREVTGLPSHDQLQQRFKNYIQKTGATRIKADCAGVDIQFRLTDGVTVLAEVKPCDKSDARYAVRTALGQLLDYAQRHSSKPVHLLVVLEIKPSNEEIDLAVGNGFGIAYPWGNKFILRWPPTASPVLVTK